MKRGKTKGMEIAELPGPEAVERRVIELGLTVELLVAAIRRGQNAADFCTPSHPKTYPGSVAWGETTAGVRDDTSVLGWVFGDEDNIPRTTSPDGSVTVIVVSGNHRTGLRSEKAPQGKRPRGEAGIRLVRRHAQIELEELLPVAVTSGEEETITALGPTWFLMYCRAENVVRGELSLAKGVSDSGRLLEWSERLILPEIDLLNTPDTTNRSSETVPDVNVPVERRAG